MFSHDPFQSYQALGAFGGGANPYGLPYAGINPLAFGVQPLANQGIGGFGQYPQQFQGYPQQQQAYAPQGVYPQQLQGGIGQQGPWQQFQPWNQLAGGFQNPMQQHHQQGHPGLQNPALQNPMLAASLQNPLLNPILAYQAWQQQQTPFTYPLAPQSLIGGAGIGQQYGQINPLALLALRQGGLGLSPFAGY